jgi:hypothetical protein
VPVEIAEVGLQHRLSADRQHSDGRKRRPFVQGRHETAKQCRNRANDGDLVVQQPRRELTEAAFSDIEGKQRRAVEERAVDRPHRVGEAERRRKHPPIARPGGIAMSDVASVGEDIPVAVHHPFGTSRRAGCIDDQRQPFGGRRGVEVGAGQARIDVAEIDELDRAPAQPARRVAITPVRNHEPGSGVVQHVLQSIRRVTRIQHDVEFAGLQHRQDRGKRIAAMFEQQCNRFGRRSTPREYRACQSIRRFVE